MSLRNVPPLVWVISVIVLLAITLPYGYAARSAGESDVFGGFLLNPKDGNSYLAKMYQGWQGSWKYTLPYTAQMSQGAYLFLFYLALGHVARVVQLPLIWVFHFARLCGAVFMLWALYRFCRAFFKEPRQLWLAFGVAALGSGMGWMLLMFGAFTSDFWVAEAYPFLSAYVNPHFPISLGLLLMLLYPASSPHSRADLTWGWKIAQGGWWAFVVALGIAILSPFAVVIALLVLGAMSLLSALSRRDSWRAWIYAGRLFWAALGGLPVMLYDLMVVRWDAPLRAWNAQNRTPAPPLWDIVISFSPLLLLAILGGVHLWKARRFDGSPGNPDWRLPLVWGALTLLMLYLPLSLQRRFLLGWYVPLAILAIPGLEWLSAGRRGRMWILTAMLLLLVLPTNAIILATVQRAVQTREAELYLRRDEVLAFDWLKKEAPRQTVVLAAPRTGMFIPAHTGLRVVYGHPFETADAENQELAVLDFFTGALEQDAIQDFLWRNQVGYIFYGPSERALGRPAYLLGLPPVFDSEEVQIYSPATGQLPVSLHESEGQVR